MRLCSGNCRHGRRREQYNIRVTVCLFVTKVGHSRPLLPVPHARARAPMGKVPLAAPEPVMRPSPSSKASTGASSSGVTKPAQTDLDSANNVALEKARAEVSGPWAPRVVHKDAGASMLPVAVIAVDGGVSWMNSRAAPGADGLWPWMVLEGGVLRTIQLDMADHMPLFGLQRARTYLVDPAASPPV